MRHHTYIQHLDVDEAIIIEVDWAVFPGHHLCGYGQRCAGVVTTHQLSIHHAHVSAGHLDWR